MAAQFGGSPIQFLSVTDEERGVVENFLEKRPIRGWIGFDSKRELFKAYAVDGIPLTVLVDRSGKVAAITAPNLVSKERIDDLLAGRPVRLPLPSKERETLRSGVEASTKPLLDVLVRPSTTGAVSLRRGPGKFVGSGLTLRLILANAYCFPMNRIEGEPVIDETRYDVSLASSDHHPIQTEFIQQLVAAAFHLQVRRETRDTDVLVLEAPNGKPPALAPTVSTGGSLSTGSQFIGADVVSLAATMEEALHRTVIDETALAGRYDFTLQWDRNQPESILDAVRNQLGLTVVSGRRPGEFLIVERK